MVERDALAWFVDLATVAAGVAGAVALWMSHRAIRDSSATARELTESRHLADLARKRAEAKQAARVLGIADELAGNIRGRWQCMLVPLKSHPSAGQINGLLGSLKRDLELVSELRARASAIDLETVQLALLIHSRLVGFEGLLEGIENQAQRAADSNVATRAQHLERWHLVRNELLGRTVDIQDLLQRLEAHFAAEPRLLRGMDRESYAEMILEDLQRGRDAKVQAMIERQGHGKPGSNGY
jgi:hypothetical protein